MNQSNQLNVVVLGHSWVRDLGRLWENASPPYQVCHGDHTLTIKTYAKPGGTYSDFISDFEGFKPLLLQNPEVIVVLLGSNDIKVDVPLQAVKNQAIDLYKLIKETAPNGKLYTVEIEDRFLWQTNRHGTPDESEYRRLSRHLNRLIKKAPHKDGVLVIRGNILSNERLYKRDKTHLNSFGLRTYAQWLETSIIQYYNKQNN